MLAIRELRFAYRKGGEELFDGLSHDFAPGRLTVLTGPSGRGKSTLLYLLALLLTPSSGDVLLDGVSLGPLRDVERSGLRARRIGFIFQDAELDPSRTVLDSVLEPTLYAGGNPDERTEAARALLADFGLAHRANHQPGQISGGQAQRVAVCRALINEPDIVLADEPTGNLDRTNTLMVLETLAEVAAGGRTVMIASHDPFVVERADAVVDL